MNQAAILLWFSGALAGHSPVDVGLEPTSPISRDRPTFVHTPEPMPRERASLNAWAESRQLTLMAPARHTSSLQPDYDAALVERIEELLEQARLSAGSLEEKLALDQLEAAQALIYEHAELPQAAYLLAEAAWQQASIVEQAGHSRLAEIHRLRAAALEGPRTRPYAATTEVPAIARTSPLVSENLEQRIHVRGLAATDSLKWDGSVQRSRRFVTSVGEHHAYVIREGALLWAGFVMVHRTVEQLDIQIQPPDPCSNSDLASVRLARDRVVIADRVKCPLWVVARPAAVGAGVDVTLCRFERCGRLLNWQSGLGQPLVAPLHEGHPAKLPAWAAYVAAGVGVAAATTFILWQAGAFDDPETPPPTWTFGGISD